jgi:hypothetical protein
MSTLEAHPANNDVIPCRIGAGIVIFCPPLPAERRMTRHGVDRVPFLGTGVLAYEKKDYRHRK